MEYDLRPYCQANWHDSWPLVLAAALFPLFCIFLAVIDYQAIVSQPLQSMTLLREIVIVAGIVGGGYTLVMSRVSLTLREAEVTPRGVKLRWVSQRKSDITWGQRMLRILDDSRIKRLATLPKGDPRLLVGYRLIYRKGILMIGFPIPKGMAREILELARQAGLLVKERVIPSGPKANETEYTLQRR